MSEANHAKMSPSGAHRWMRCPASLLLEQTLPDTSSKYADEGTRAHAMAASVLEGIEDIGPRDDISMAEYIADYAKLVREYAEGGTLLVEQKSSNLDLGRAQGQALDYVEGLHATDQPRWVLTCDFQTWVLLARLIHRVGWEGLAGVA